MTAYWFRPKRYGYGATPCTWQGWALTAAAVLVIVATSIVLPPTVKSIWSLAAFFAIEAVVLGAFGIIAYRKTEGGWRWRWGDH